IDTPRVGPLGGLEDVAESAGRGRAMAQLLDEDPEVHEPILTGRAPSVKDATVPPLGARSARREAPKHLALLLAQAARVVEEFRRRATGSLAIVASGIPATYLLPDVLAAFQRAHPGVRVSIDLVPSAQAVESVRAHRAEFGVVGGFASAPEIEAEPLVEDEIVLMGPPELAGRRMTRREAESLTWISRVEGSALRAAVEAAWADSGISPG